MYQVVAIGGGTDRQLLDTFASKQQAKDYALDVNTFETEVVNDRTGLLVGYATSLGLWREQLRPARREILTP